MSRVSYISRFKAFKCPKSFSSSVINKKPYSSLTFRDPRTFSTSSVMYQPRSLAKLKKLQQDYQCEDGRPIWLKQGFCDRLLYTTTILSCYLGVFMVLSTVYDHAKPESWKKKQTC